MFKGILLDIDNTLYNYDFAHNTALNFVNDFIMKKYLIADFMSFYEKARFQINKNLKNTAASHNRLLYFQLAFEHMGKFNLLEVKNAYTLYWNVFLNNMIINEGVQEFLQYYKDKKICLITDLTAYIQYRKVEKLKIDEYIDYIVTSEEIGVEKPDKKIFTRALQKINLSSGDVCMIGDSYEKDIVGSLNIGIKPYWLTDKTICNQEITCFKNFNELIGKI